MAQDQWRNAYCAVLGVDPSAEKAEIQRAYRNLVLRYHPDRNPHDPDAAKRFEAVEEAYEALCEPERRRILGAFHTPWSMFLTTRCHSKSPRNFTTESTSLAIPLSVVCTAIYLMILSVCLLFSVTMPGPEASDYYLNYMCLRIAVVSSSVIYGLGVATIILFFAQRR